MQLKLDVCLTEIHNKVCKKGWCVDLKGYSFRKKKKKKKNLLDQKLNDLCNHQNYQ